MAGGDGGRIFQVFKFSSFQVRKRFFSCFFVVVVKKLLGSIPIFQAKIRMMLAQKETIEKELAKLQVVIHTNYLPYHN